MLAAPVLWIGNAILINQPQGYGEMGIYNAANSWRSAVLFIPGTLSGIVLPLLSNLKGASDTRSFLKILRLNILLNGGFTAVVAIVISIFSSVIMTSFGEGFSSSQLVLILLVWSGVFYAVTIVIGQSIASGGNMWIGFILNSVWALVYLGVTWWFREFGAKGIALANLVSYIVHMALVGTYLFYFILPRNNKGL